MEVVVQSVKGRKAQVAFGQILTTVDRKMLTVVSNSEFREATRPQTARTVVSAGISARKLSFKDHIDVRGMRAAEALDAVQDFIDDALMEGERVGIVINRSSARKSGFEFNAQLLRLVTVSDIPGFAQLGGMIELPLEGERVGIVINRSSARKSGFEFNAQLLRLARVIDR
jgi:hypothetical protein